MRCLRIFYNTYFLDYYTCIQLWIKSIFLAQSAAAVAVVCCLGSATTSMLNWIWDTWESVPYSHIKAAHFRATEYIYILWEQSRHRSCCHCHCRRLACRTHFRRDSYIRRRSCAPGNEFDAKLKASARKKKVREIAVLQIKTASLGLHKCISMMRVIKWLLHEFP